jgi:hypothetical protein
MNSDKQPNSSRHSGERLSQDWIEATRSGEKVSDTSDAFERDAREGWQKASTGSELMHRLDLRFNRKPRTAYYLVALLLVGFGAAGGILLLSSEPSVPAKTIVRQIPVDKIDIVLPPAIQDMKALPEDLQIQPKQVRKTFQQKAAQMPTAAPEALVEAPIYLSPRKLEHKQPQAVLSTNKRKAKEIYLAGMKLIDYRAYRSKPQISSQQIILSGLSADQEKSGLESDQVDWKPIDVPYYDYIAKTVEQFADGNIRQTLNRTQSILTFYPDDANALFYGGLCYYNLNEMDQAIAAFQQVMELPYDNFDEEALWYLANAYELKHEKAKARELYQYIVAQKGFYAPQAEKRLQ